MDTWSFAEVLRTSVRAVARACGLPAVSLLARVLDETVAVQAPSGFRDARRDNSGWWRPSIGGQPAGTDTDPASALVSALRDACTEALSTEADLAAVIAEIESHDWPVFRRLALFLLSEHVGDGDAALVGARLSDAAVVQDPVLDREFLLLVRRRCSVVGARDRERLFALIDRGPQAPQQQLRREQDGIPLSAAQTRALVCRWQRDRLAAIEPVLPAERLAHYRDLVAEFGAAPENLAALPPVRSIFVGSPVAAGDLAASSTEDLAKLLATWEPPGGLLGADRPGLASALSTAVRQDAAGRSSAAEAFTGLPGVYVEAVISAFWQAAQEGTALDWPAVLNLCTWADQQAEAELRDPGDRLWRQWEAARMASLRLLEAGFASGHEIPADLGGQAWAIIENAAADPDPKPAAEAEADASGRPLGEVAMAHVKPKALTTVFAYVAWARRGNPEAGLGAVQQLIENLIDPAQPAPSRAVRWVCGASFGVLAGFFRPWAVEKTPVIFPLGDTERDLWTAAWGGYLDRFPVLDMCETLDGSYQLAVDSLDPGGDDRAELARATGLGLHLIIRYWHGRLTSTAHDQLLRRYYRSAPAEARAYPMQFLGRQLAAADTVPAALITRLWEERLQAVRSGADSAELAGFGEWFAAGKLGEEWELRQLITVLRDAGKIESEHLVLPRLAALAPAHPDACLTALEAWVLTNPTLYWLQRQDDSIRAILAAGAGNGDPGAGEKVTAIISLCTIRGHDMRHFRDS